MSSDSQFTAHGPAIIGFQTNATRIDRGADIFGNEFGIRGASHNGAGVKGESTNDAGVEGKGETGIVGDGIRGPGVEGLGGNQPFTALLGAGVVGRGGRERDEDNKEQQLHGPGVMGIGGGRSRELPVHSNSMARSVGVFGQGAEAETRVVDGTIHGPLAPGAGVVGQGGVSSPRKDQVAPGVIGLAGGAAEAHGAPNTGVGVVADIGVLGFGAVGIMGEGRETGVFGAGRDGVKGVASEGRGGLFESERSAQVQLIPAKRPGSFDQTSLIPTAIADPGRLGPELPKEGRGGDLMSVINDERQCSLWFCVRDSTPDRPARWAQVLLGPLFDGRA